MGDVSQVAEYAAKTYQFNTSDGLTLATTNLQNVMESGASSIDINGDGELTFNYEGNPYTAGDGSYITFSGAGTPTVGGLPSSVFIPVTSPATATVTTTSTVTLT